MAKKFVEFPKRDVPVTLTGEEWVAVLARIVGQKNPRYALNAKGAAIYNRAATKLQRQLMDASGAVRAEREAAHAKT